MTKIVVRAAGQQDAEVFGVMYREFREYLNSLQEDSAEPLLLNRDAGTFLRDRCGDRQFFSSVICELGGEPAGYFSYHYGYWAGEAAGCLYVTDIFVRKFARRGGVGHALMNEAVRLLKQRGGPVILWTVWHRNTAAIEFYEALGATPVGDEDLMILRP